jgi:Transposase DDE domain
MMHESLLGKDWLATVARFGGPELLDKEAREIGAFRRARAVKCPVDLLRLTLAYCLGTMGLRLTAGWAEAVGLASLSNVALLKRLRNMAPWLELLVARLLVEPGRGAKTAVAGGRLIRLVDATTVVKAGRDARSSGGVWRVHAVFDLPSERFSEFELTDETEGEVLDRAAVVPGEIRIADRAYLQPDRLAKVLAAGADVIIRAPWNGARWVDEDANSVDLIAMLKAARGKGFVDRPIWIKASAKTPIAVRLVALRKPDDAIAASVEKARATAKGKGKLVMPETLLAAEWVILVTSLNATTFPAIKIGELYRMRWRIEIAFKHLKSVVGLGRPPGEDASVAKAHVLCHLLMILLTEPLMAGHLGDSPRLAAA